MSEIDFKQIAPRCGGQREAFEELCCQLARRTLDVELIRLEGAGGDGGVECYADLPDDGNRIGWQVKFVFDVDLLIAQVKESLATALRIHPSLARYVVCFPFNLSGPTARRGLSGQQKIERWKQNVEAEVASSGRELTIEFWPESRLRSFLLDYDTFGGIRFYFFNQFVLTPKWFAEHLEQATITAGPRYTPKLNVETDLWSWIAAFGRGADWFDSLEKIISRCNKELNDLRKAVNRNSPDPAVPAWPDDYRPVAIASIGNMQDVIDGCSRIVSPRDSVNLIKYVEEVNALVNSFEELESYLVDELEAKHGHGKADSPGFRQFMAEYMCSFPTANIDCLRDAIAAVKDLSTWLGSPSGFLGLERGFVLSGLAGSGKTHGVCDAAHHRFQQGRLSCVLFGHQFKGEPDPWTRLIETLGLPVTLGMAGILDAINAAAEASGFPFIIFVDAINETRPFSYWHKRLGAFVQDVLKKPFLRICVTCRTTFLPNCLPDQHALPVVEHQGFAGIEREACTAFFRFYGLKPPVIPIPQPELSNPLYLRLVCETLKACGLDSLPSGWLGLSPVIRAFLEEKEKQFSEDYETLTGANIIGNSLRSLARGIADSGSSSMPWSKAQSIISQIPTATSLPVLHWLVQSDLLIEDAPAGVGAFNDESELRLAFERLGDFLIASELLAKAINHGIEKAFQPAGVLSFLVDTVDATAQNAGILSALSIILPEYQAGLELPDLIENEEVRAEVLKTTLLSFPWREPSTFSSASAYLVRQGLAIHGFSAEAMETVLSVAWQPSAIDACWLDAFLKERPMARRDAFWCWFLHEQYEKSGTVRRLIDAAFDLTLDEVASDVVERWAILLLWFTAAADRRVKDRASRAAVSLLTSRPERIPPLLSRLLDCDDDEVRERTLLVCYGALILTRNIDVIKITVTMLNTMYKNAPNLFDNALIRDHIRCLTELALETGVLPAGFDIELAMRPIKSSWPLDFPTDDEVKHWEALPKLAHSCTDDDFYIYSMNCLRRWLHTINKPELGKWILEKIVVDFGYEKSGCEEYDKYMLGKYGGGRARKRWADRIGKKYQWVALFQLASRLSDHVEPKTDDWDPKTLRTPLILLEERKLDPTLPSNVAAEDEAAINWWIPASVDFESGVHLSDVEWIKKQDDLPLFDQILSIQEKAGQPWRLLASYPEWREREDSQSDDPYRHVWMHIQSYLVMKEDFENACYCLQRRNFFGDWMPGHSSWLYAFAGEYPWATPFNTEPDQWHSQGNMSSFLPRYYKAAWNKISAEWEYDSCIPKSHFKVPARDLFALNDLWWNGKNGFKTSEGKTVFQDPYLTESGTSALVADANDLFERLDKLGLRLIWTLLGEKWIIGGREISRMPICTFSQIASLGEDGSLKTGDRVFFDSYDKAAGPLVPK